MKSLNYNNIFNNNNNNNIFNIIIDENRVLEVVAEGGEEEGEAMLGRQPPHDPALPRQHVHRLPGEGVGGEDIDS